jgi:hypothetical protein
MPSGATSSSARQPIFPGTAYGFPGRCRGAERHRPRTGNYIQQNDFGRPLWKPPIPYPFADRALAPIVEPAIADLAQKAVLSFVPRTTETDYIEFAQIPGSTSVSHGMPDLRGRNGTLTLSRVGQVPSGRRAGGRVGDRIHWTVSPGPARILAVEGVRWLQRKFHAPRSKMCTPMLRLSVGLRASSWITPKSVSS